MTTDDICFACDEEIGNEEYEVLAGTCFHSRCYAAKDERYDDLGHAGNGPA